MADWNAPLPDEAVEGELTHIDDHNAIVAAIEEARLNLDSTDAAVAGKADTTHSHAVDQVTGLQDALDGKQAAGSYAAATHSHAIDEITGLQAALDDKMSGTGVSNIQVLTQAEYDALTPDEDTLYLIREA